MGLALDNEQPKRNQVAVAVRRTMIASIVEHADAAGIERPTRDEMNRMHTMELERLRSHTVEMARVRGAFLFGDRASA